MIHWPTQTAYSDPGRHAPLLHAVPPDLATVAAATRNVLVHYRACPEPLPPETAPEVNSRWLEVILDHDQTRHPVPLMEPRPVSTRVQACCRDFTLLAVAILRAHGIPARSRVGFAGYFVPGWHHDHVVPEVWQDGRWRRFEPEVEAPTELLADPLDLPPGSGFRTAAQVWRGWRAGQLDLSTYGVDPAMPAVAGPWFVANYLILEVAHRYGDELLLWDGWGGMSEPGEPRHTSLLDEIADLLVAADTGDVSAEKQLLARYRADDRLHPGESVSRHDVLTGGPPVPESLARGGGG